MAYFPKNPRSELTLLNWPGVGVLDTRRMFQLASPASVTPALRPTRGSGFGAAAFAIDAISKWLCGAGAPASEMALPCAQAPRSAATGMRMDRRSNVMREVCYGLAFVVR